jgi:hypothetical protein
VESPPSPEPEVGEDSSFSEHTDEDVLIHDELKEDEHVEGEEMIEERGESVVGDCEASVIKRDADC